MILPWLSAHCHCLWSYCAMSEFSYLVDLMVSVAIRDPDRPEVLIEGVLFRARYLGSTQLVSEGQPSKAMRMMQAQEAVGRIKVSGSECCVSELYRKPGVFPLSVPLCCWLYYGQCGGMLCWPPHAKGTCSCPVTHSCVIWSWCCRGKWDDTYQHLFRVCNRVSV